MTYSSTLQLMTTKDSVTSFTMELNIISIPHTHHGINLGVVVHDALWVSAAVISRVRVRDAPACQHENQIGHKDLSYLTMSPHTSEIHFEFLVKK